MSKLSRSGPCWPVECPISGVLSWMLRVIIFSIHGLPVINRVDYLTLRQLGTELFFRTARITMWTQWRHVLFHPHWTQQQHYKLLLKYNLTHVGKDIAWTILASFECDLYNPLWIKIISIWPMVHRLKFGQYWPR